MIYDGEDVDVERLTRAPQTLARRVPLHRTRWGMGWFETIGFGLLLGAAGAYAALQVALLWGGR